jgi:2-oxoglutarate ferredoxin oxidoreductase subunit beta
MSRDGVAMKAKDYKSSVEPVWCPGCGDFGDLAGFTQALADLQLKPENMAIISGIGCSGRFSHFIKCYAYHTAHGRAIPTAIGVKTGNPDLDVFVVAGDGDSFSIGGGHLPHAARRNPNITYLILDNAIYGLTKGQSSPTTPQGMATGTSPYGMYNPPIDPVQMLLAYGATFVARGFSSNVKQVCAIVKAAVEHRGFSAVQLVSPCPTFNKVITFDYMKQRVTEIPEDHDTSDKEGAYGYALDPERVYTGIFYRSEQPTMFDKHEFQVNRSIEDNEPRTVEELFSRF